MWYSIYTKPRKEDSVAFLLRNIGIEVLNPRLKSQKYKNNKFLEAIEPLFPCYIFAHFEKDKYAHLITYTRGVRYIVGKKDPIAVPDDVIRVIKENMEDGDIVAVKARPFKKGDKVLIKEGPLKDFYGLFERESKGPERVMILLSTLNCRIEMDARFLAIA